MLKFYTACILLICAQPAFSQDIRIQVDHIRDQKGEILLAVYAQPEGFPFESARANSLHRATPADGHVEFHLKAMPQGRYAIALFQDTNKDGKFNTNFLGIPKEGYGVSNNAYNTFSAPEFEAAAFWHRDKTTLRITMKY